MGPSQQDLERAEHRLRKNDRALRLRFSLERPAILIERKVRRGRIGPMLHGEAYSPDAGSRIELGHVNVGAIPRDKFDFRLLEEQLRAFDTWKGDKPLWRRMEEQEERDKSLVVQRRKDMVRYRTEDMWDNYVWKYKQRVSVPVQLS